MLWSRIYVLLWHMIISHITHELDTCKGAVNLCSAVSTSFDRPVIDHAAAVSLLFAASKPMGLRQR